MKPNLKVVILTISKILDTYLESESVINIKISSKVGSYEATIDSNSNIIEAKFIPVSKDP